MFVSYICEEKKSVILLSSSKPNTQIMVWKKDKADKKKPEIINTYNHTKVGVDKFDEMTKNMSCVRATRSWAVNLFCDILDMMMAFNSYILYTIGIDKDIGRRNS